MEVKTSNEGILDVIVQWQYHYVRIYNTIFIYLCVCFGNYDDDIIFS